MNETAAESGLIPDRLAHLIEVIEEDVAREKYHGAVICIGRHGRIGLHDAVGHAYKGREQPLQKNSVFNIFSVTKALTNVLVFRAVERGELSLHTKVTSIIPEFSGGTNDDLNVFHLLTHQTGIPLAFEPRPGMYIDRLAEVIEAICEEIKVTEAPGTSVTYSPLVAHALMGEMLQRVDPQRRRYRQLVEEEIFTPLGMKDSAIGLREDLKDRKVRPDFLSQMPAKHLGHSDFGPHGAFEEEDAEMPWVGAVSTAQDLYRFAEMLRCGGELDGARILSPAILDQATRNRTGAKPNNLYEVIAKSRGLRFEPYPAYFGLGFTLSGEEACPHQFGTLTSPRTFGNFGAGSTLFWVDPKLDMTFSFVSAGVMDEAENLGRFQRLSDIAISAAA
jgi:CubicO group peptidase (beta-lactamase class C family)